MDFVSLEFYLFLFVVLAAYYLVPPRFRWYVLLAGSFAYFWLATVSVRSLVVFIGIIVVSWAFGLVLEAVGHSNRDVFARKLVVVVCVALVLIPLVLSKFQPLLATIETLLGCSNTGVVVSIGLSFFTMQIIAYLVDVYRGTVAAQHNFLKYTLFVSFFPQIIQGPIPRYEQLEPQLVEGHRFDARGVTKGFMLILWGFFLKFMIADKAGVVVDAIFGNTDAYRGVYVLVGGVLYSVQLYADFLACTTLARGVAELFGIQLVNNFDHPYLSCSIKEFWGRWHISLSSWLRDYVYIPLGGNRKGALRRYINVAITFAVSGIWHGTGWKYLLWGLMHAAYQIVGELTQRLRDRFFALLGISAQSDARRWISRTTTFVLVMLAWIVFRASSTSEALFMLHSLVATYNPWVLFDDSLLELGLGWKQWIVLLASIGLLIQVSVWQGRMSLCDRVLEQPFVVRCMLYVVTIVCIMVFGTYGYGFDAADFIYGGF